MQTQSTFWRNFSLILLLIFSTIGVINAQDDSVLIDTLTILESGSAVAGDFEDEINTQLYAFYASAGDTISISMTQESDDLDPFLVLLDASGSVLAMDDDSGATFLSAEISAFEIPDDGAYLILATSLRFLEGTDTVSDSVSYALTLSGNRVPNGIDAEDEIELVATPLDYGLVVESESSEDAPAAFFVFEGAADDVVNIVVESDEFPTVLHLFAPDGTRLAVDPSAITNLELPDDGIYLILATDVFFYDAMQDDTFFLGGVFLLSLNGS